MICCYWRLWSRDTFRHYEWIWNAAGRQYVLHAWSKDDYYAQRSKEISVLFGKGDNCCDYIGDYTSERVDNPYRKGTARFCARILTSSVAGYAIPVVSIVYDYKSKEKGGEVNESWAGFLRDDQIPGVRTMYGFAYGENGDTAVWMLTDKWDWP